MSSGNPLIWGSKVKGERHKVCVGLQTERNIAAAAYVSHSGFFPAVVPRRTNIAGDTGVFPCVTPPRPI